MKADDGKRETLPGPPPDKWRELKSRIACAIGSESNAGVGDRRVVNFHRSDWREVLDAMEAACAPSASVPRAEIRLNDGGTLDEVVTKDGDQLEQMDFNHWFLQIGDVAVWLHSNRRITATYERRALLTASPGNEQSIVGTVPAEESDEEFAQQVRDMDKPVSHALPSEGQQALQRAATQEPTLLSTFGHPPPSSTPPSQHTHGSGPCPDGDACPDARRYGKIHPAPSQPAEGPTPETDRLESGIDARHTLRGFYMPEDVVDLLVLARTLERQRDAVAMRAEELIKMLDEALFTAGKLAVSPPSAIAPSLEAVLDEYERRTKAIPLGEENPHHGKSVYNWRMAVLHDLRHIAGLNAVEKGAEPT